jgi:hypothetical protein
MSTYRIPKYLLLLLAAAVLLMQYACKKENAGGKAPKIERIRAISPAPDDSVLTSAVPGQYVVLQGNNLASTTQVLFNGFPAAINTALFADNNLVVIVPTIAWDSIPEGKLNTVEVVSPGGSDSYQFTITAPLPTVKSLSNEMAKAGQTLVINGDNFYGVTKVIFPGDIEVDDPAVSGITRITLTVPSGITESGPIRVVGQYGTGVSILLFNDYTTGMLTTFDDGNYSWGAYEITDNATLFPDNMGSYAHIAVTGGVGAGDFAWYDGIRSVNTNTITWIPSDHLGDPLASYALKFEMSLKQPWSGGSFYIVKDYDWTYLARYEPWANNGGAPVTTNGWVTAVIPLTQFKTNANGLDGTGSPAANLATLVGDGTGSLSVMLVNSGSANSGPIDIAFDNFRIEKIQ